MSGPKSYRLWVGVRHGTAFYAVYDQKTGDAVFTDHAAASVFRQTENTSARNRFNPL